MYTCLHSACLQGRIINWHAQSQQLHLPESVYAHSFEQWALTPEGNKIYHTNSSLWCSQMQCLSRITACVWTLWFSFTMSLEVFCACKKSVYAPSITYLILHINFPKASLLFLMFSVVLSPWMQKYVSLFHESCLDSETSVILNGNYATWNLLSVQDPDSCCCLWNVLLLDFSNLPETRISLLDQHFFPGIKLEKLSGFAESLRIWINRFESQHCANPRWILLLEKKNAHELCAILESCQLPFNINQDSGDLWLAWCYPPAKWVSSY